MLLRRRITRGEWSLGDRLPTLSELTVEFEVARITMQQALTRLADEGLILRHRGRGTFVIAEPIEQRWFTLATDFEGLTAIPASQRAQLVECHPSRHLPPVSDAGCNLAEHYQFLRHVHWRATVPTAVTDIHIARDLFERAGRDAFEDHDVMTVLAGLDHLTLTEARQTLTIGAADMEMAGLLEMPMNTPLAELRRLVLDREGGLAYIGHLVFRGDLVRLDFNLHRAGAPESD